MSISREFNFSLTTKSYVLNKITVQMPSIDGNIRWVETNSEIFMIDVVLYNEQKEGNSYRLTTNENVVTFRTRKFRSQKHENVFWLNVQQHVPITLNLFEPDWPSLKAEFFFRTQFTVDRWDLKVAISKCLDFNYDGDICRVANISSRQLERYMRGGQLYLPQGVDISAIADVWSGVLAEPANLWKNHQIPARQYWEYWLSSFTH